MPSHAALLARVRVRHAPCQDRYDLAGGRRSQPRSHQAVNRQAALRAAVSRAFRPLRSKAERRAAQLRRLRIHREEPRRERGIGRQPASDRRSEVLKGPLAAMTLGTASTGRHRAPTIARPSIRRSSGATRRCARAPAACAGGSGADRRRAAGREAPRVRTPVPAPCRPRSAALPRATSRGSRSAARPAPDFRSGLRRARAPSASSTSSSTSPPVMKTNSARTMRCSIASSRDRSGIASASAFRAPVQPFGLHDQHLLAQGLALAIFGQREAGGRDAAPCGRSRSGTIRTPTDRPGLVIRAIARRRACRPPRASNAGSDSVARRRRSPPPGAARWCLPFEGERRTGSRHATIAQTRSVSVSSVRHHVDADLRRCLGQHEVLAGIIDPHERPAIGLDPHVEQPAGAAVRPALDQEHARRLCDELVMPRAAGALERDHRLTRFDEPDRTRGLFRLQADARALERDDFGRIHEGPASRPADSGGRSATRTSPAASTSPRPERSRSRAGSTACDAPARRR